MRKIIQNLLFILLVVIIFKSETISEVVDYEGNVYKTVIIGNQEWMAENLKSAYFNDGQPIDIVTISSTWTSIRNPATCWYNNDSATHHEIYGRMYNGYAATNPNICPDGWSVPTADDWDLLVSELGGKYFAGGSLKQTGTEHWESPNEGATNSSGFSAYPSGWRSNVDGNFNWKGQRAGWFVLVGSNTVAFRFVSWSMPNAGSGAIPVNAGLCIRCFRNITSSSIDEPNDNIKLSIAPNPASDYITINFKPSEGLEPPEGYLVQVFDMLGIEVARTPSLVNNMKNTQAGASELLRINVSHLPAGVYFIRIGNKVGKFVKK